MGSVPRLLPAAALLWLAAAAAAGCAGAPVAVDYDRDAAFPTYRTFAWLGGPGERSGAPEEVPRSGLHRVVAGALVSRGLAETDRAAADLWVRYRTRILAEPARPPADRAAATSLPPFGSNPPPPETELARTDAGPAPKGGFVVPYNRAEPNYRDVPKFPAAGYPPLAGGFDLLGADSNDPWGLSPDLDPDWNRLRPDRTYRSNAVRWDYAGTLTIELIDRKAGRVVWEGTTSEPAADRKAARRPTPGAAARIMAAFPPDRR